MVRLSLISSFSFQYIFDKYIQTYNLCLEKLLFWISRKKFEPWTSRSLAWRYYWRYPASIEFIGLTLSSKQYQTRSFYFLLYFIFLVCDTICHLLTGQLTSLLFFYSGVLNQIIKCKIYNLRLVKLQFRYFKREFRTWLEIRTLDFQISNLTLYHFNYPDSIDSIGLNFSVESNAMEGVFLVSIAICYHLIGE